MAKHIKLTDKDGGWIIGNFQSEVFDASKRTADIKIDAAYGNDTLISGAGSDTLIGGGGADKLVMGGSEKPDTAWINKWAYSRNVEGERDTIEGFRPGTDKISLVGATNDPITWDMVEQIPMGADLRVVVHNSERADNCISFDLTGVAALTAADFIGLT